MKQIKYESIKVGDWVYIQDKTDKGRRFFINILKIEKSKWIIKWWGLKKGSRFSQRKFISSPKGRNNPCYLNQSDWGDYKIMRMNKKDMISCGEGLVFCELGK